MSEQLSHEVMIPISLRYGPASNPEPPMGRRVPEVMKGQKHKGQTSWRPRGQGRMESVRATWPGATCSNLSPENQWHQRDRHTAGQGHTAVRSGGDSSGLAEQQGSESVPEAASRTPTARPLPRSSCDSPKLPGPAPPWRCGRVSRLGTETPSASLHFQNC